MVNLLEYKIDEQFKNTFFNFQNKEIVLFCVGNHKIWYDSFGPTFAEMARKNNIHCFIYGGEQTSIVPDNLLDYMKFVESKHPSATIVIVDNCLTSTTSNLYDIEIKRNAIIPASLFNNLSFGDISIVLKIGDITNYKKYLLFQQQTINVLIKKLQKYIG